MPQGPSRKDRYPSSFPTRRGDDQRRGKPTSTSRNRLIQGNCSSVSGSITGRISRHPRDHDSPDGGVDDLRDQDSNDGALQEVIMAFDMRDKATMGCAFFNTAEGILKLANEVPMANAEVAEQFLIHVQPTTVLISGRAPENILACLEKQAEPNNPGYQSPKFILRVVPSSDFSHSSAREKLISLGVHFSTPIQAIFSIRGGGHLAPDSDDSLNDHDYHESSSMKLMRCSSSINLDSLASVNCAGAVLADLHRRRSIGLLPDGQSAEFVFRVSSIQLFSLSGFMFVNEDTLLSLQIIQHELHPNSQAWGPGTKESLSVYGLFHLLASTPQGRTCLRQLFLRPTLLLDVIIERQQTISLLVRPENEEKVKQATSILRKIPNVRLTLSHLHRGVNSPSTGRSFDKGVWATLRRFAAQALKLSEVVKALHEGSRSEIISKLITGISPHILVSIGEMINRIVDFDQSKSRQRCSIKVGVDDQLDKLKRRYDGMGSFLTEVVNQVSRELPEWACQYIRSCIFLPQLGFLMVVEQDPHTGNGKYEGEGTNGDRWEKLFTDDGTVCYKNRFMTELDHQYGDMYCEIGDREVEILHRLATDILKHEDALASTSDICGEFDAILALALGAKKYGWTAPQMTTANILDIKGGRHPLQELVVPAFVPNDCYIGGGRRGCQAIAPNEPQALVLTGPNHSGKSVYIKQAAIIVYLAHIGSFVPAEQATIGITDKILTLISARESVSRLESAFAIDLKQAAQAIQYSTVRSLVVVDEFGKGTNADGGAGLLAALLDHFLSLETNMPKLLLATHFHEVFDGGYLSRHNRLFLGHMDVRTDWEAVQEDDHVTYLFKFTPGHNVSSFGSHCAALNGVPRAVVDRSETISLLLGRNEDLGSSCARLLYEEEKHLEAAEAIARRFLQAAFGPSCAGTATAVRSLLEGILSWSS